MNRVVYIVSDIDKALAFEWISTYLPEMGCPISFILLNPGESHLEKFLREKKISVDYVRCRGKLDWPRALYKTYQILRNRKPDIVHCHLLTASLLGLCAAKIAGVPNRIYTRHHSSLHHVYFRKGVIWDKITNRLATRVVAISDIVREILSEWERLSLQKIILIPHGFRLNDFVPRIGDSNSWKVKHGLGSNTPVIGVVSRFTEWKGIQYIIPAFQQFLGNAPGAILLLFNARGDYANILQQSLSELPYGTYRTIEYEEDMRSAYAAMDIFIHVPVDEHSEAFGQIYVEALAAGVPSIFTLSGIAPDFIRNEENAMVVPFRNSDAIYLAMIRLWESEKLRSRLSSNGPISVKQKFDLPVMIGALDNLYRTCLNH
jgi:glycosyltransferase involved in cell wall biosynthesis